MLIPLLVVATGILFLLGAVAVKFVGPSAARAGARRLTAVRDRHSPTADPIGTQMRRITGKSNTRMDLAFGRVFPNKEQLAKRLAQTGKNWTVGRYGGANAGLAAFVFLLLKLKGMPLLLCLLMGLAIGIGIPHLVVGYFIKRRVRKFTSKFPDAIDLLVRGLRSGLPISETIGVVGHEVDGPVGEEFRLISDKMKIGRTMDGSLQDTADRLSTAEFQFFVITIAIQRETGGNLAETLANLSNVLRGRSQMKLKIKAMSSESKASAYIVGSLPFIVFGLIFWISPGYMANFFIDPRLMIAGVGGLIWMSLGAFIMAKMVSFEI